MNSKLIKITKAFASGIAIAALLTGAVAFADRTFTLPDQTGHAGQFLQTDGTNPLWASAGGGGGGSIGGSIADGQIAFGSGTDSIQGDGNHLIDPATGKWNLDAAFSDPAVTTTSGTVESPDFSGLVNILTNDTLDQMAFSGSIWSNPAFGGDGSVSWTAGYNDNANDLHGSINMDANGTSIGYSSPAGESNIGIQGDTTIFKSPGRFKFRNDATANEVADFDSSTVSASIGDIAGGSRRVVLNIDNGSGTASIFGMSHDSPGTPTTQNLAYVPNGSPGLDDLTTDPTSYAGGSTDSVDVVVGDVNVAIAKVTVSGTIVPGDHFTTASTYSGKVLSVNVIGGDTYIAFSFDTGSYPAVANGDVLTAVGPATWTATVTDHALGDVAKIIVNSMTVATSYPLFYGYSDNGGLIQWGSVDGHQIGDQWTFDFVPGVPVTDYGNMLLLDGQARTVFLGDVDGLGNYGFFKTGTRAGDYGATMGFDQTNVLVDRGLDTVMFNFAGGAYTFPNATASSGQVLTDVAGDGILSWQNLFTKTITPPGTTGDQTINKSSGSVNFAALEPNLTVTDSLVSTDSVVQCTVASNDATMLSVQCIAGPGTIEIDPNNSPTGETRVNFTVTN